MTPRRAMILAAGLGTRMRPLTDTRPKPLVEVGSRALIDHALDRLEAFGIAEVVVNAHYLGDRLEAHLARRPRPPIRISREAALLGTAGGIRQALPLLGAAPFFVINADALWQDGPVPALDRLAAGWDEARMDALLLLVPAAAAVGTDGRGDFVLDPPAPAPAPLPGRVRRPAAAMPAPFFYAGVQLIHPRLLAGAPDGASSLNPLWDRALEQDRLWGLAHDGAWFHVGDPAALDQVERVFRPQPALQARS